MAYMRQRGLSAYQHLAGKWDWLYYPPPYDFLATSQPAPLPAPIIYTPAGLGGCGCGCNDGCGCGGGLGLFDSGLDLNQWGIAEWGTVAVGAYLVLSLLGDLGSARKKVGRYKSKSTARRRADLERQLEAIA